MKGINVNVFEKAIADSKKGDAVKLNWSESYIMRAYMNSKENGYEPLVVREGPWDCDSNEVAAALQSFGVDSFVLSDHSTALLNMIHMFVGCGYRLAGTIEISQEHKARYNPEWDKPLKGIIFERGQGL